MKAKFIFTADELAELARDAIQKKHNYTFSKDVEGKWIVLMNEDTGEVISATMEISDYEDEEGK